MDVDLKDILLALIAALPGTVAAVSSVKNGKTLKQANGAGRRGEAQSRSLKINSFLERPKRP